MDARGQMTIDFTQNWRNTNPDTSKDAGLKVEECGKAALHRRIILECLQIHNGSTTKELAKYLTGKLRYDEIHKRMAEMVYRLQIYRNDKIKREGCVTWWLIPQTN